MGLTFRDLLCNGWQRWIPSLLMKMFQPSPSPSSPEESRLSQPNDPGLIPPPLSPGGPCGGHDSAPRPRPLGDLFPPFGDPQTADGRPRWQGLCGHFDPPPPTPTTLLLYNGGL